MKENKKAREQRDADFLKDLEKLGESIAELGKEILGLDDDERMIMLFMITLRSRFGADVSDMMTLSVLLKMLIKKDRITTMTFLEGINMVIAKHVEKEYKGRFPETPREEN